MREICDGATIVVLTGAGISKESGLPTYRRDAGLWEGRRLEEVATPEAFARDPQLVQSFYNDRRRSLLSANVQPNGAHRALADLQRQLGRRVTLITQNVDDLHERAGSAEVIHMHGELLRVRCIVCDHREAWREEVLPTTACNECKAVMSLRPDVVWFGEMPMHLDRIEEALHACSLFAAIGTSGNVYPAAGFVSTVRSLRRAHTVELNLEPSQTHSMFRECIYGNASEIVPQWVDTILDRAGAHGGDVAGSSEG